MHGGEDSIWRRKTRHMWNVPERGTSAAQPPVGPISDPAVVADYASASFLKDGRKIQVGDCALFQSGNTQPFIGIIHRFMCKEDCLKLCVNWLYRPVDIKLAKGILLEAAPNEVFYSFHKDVISAASLLHPCKVAFLRKGVELPSGISSFVCRRVYDIANRCLWWLTDQDYISEWQEEVDQLLNKTQVEMHAAVQSGGRSPRPLNAKTSSQQLKSAPDSAQNNVTSFPMQIKGKKRERGDQVTEPIKRERPTKTDDGDHGSYRVDMIKIDIAKITEQGALISPEGVEKLVQLMQLGNERKIDLSGRVMFADVVAGTDKIECLGRFVQLRGLSVLDDWLQEAHKGRTGDGSSPKESDKGTDELLLALLRAFDKLPVNLTALKTCNIGKSVNNLRSHKNLEIQKKARILIDTWKKRVDAEMTKSNDAKFVASNQAVTWPVKQGFSEAEAGSRRAGSEVTSRSVITQLSACKMSSGKPGQADVILKPSVALESVKSSSSLLPSTTSSKESPCTGAYCSGTSELSLATVKEEKSTSMHALIEPSAPLSSRDVIGMNLLANVAAGEMSKSGLVSPSASPGTSPVMNDPCTGKDDAKCKIAEEDCMTQSHVSSDENAEINSAKQGEVAVSLSVSQELQETSIHFSGDNKSNAPLHDSELITQLAVQYPNPSVNLCKVAEISTKAEVKCVEEKADKLEPSSFSADMKQQAIDGIYQSATDARDGTNSVDCIDKKIVEDGTKNAELVGDGCDNDIAASGRTSELELEESLVRVPIDQVPKCPGLIYKQQSLGNHVEAVDRTGVDADASSINVEDPSREIVDEAKSKRCNELENRLLDQSDSGKKEKSSKVPSSIDDIQAASAISLGNEDEEALERKEILEHNSVGSASHEEPPPIPAREAKISAKPFSSRLSGADPVRREELATSADVPTVIIDSKTDTGAKLNFDLNEGFPSDDVNHGEPVASIAPVCAPAVHLSSLAPFVSGSLSNGIPAPITVAARAKGSFIPPENLLKNNGEPGWKGSAATSAFRPAEPRKVLEMPLNTSDIWSSDTCMGKLGRPLLDIDLNVPDERVPEDMASQNSPQATGSKLGVINNHNVPAPSCGGLDLDLNRVDEVMGNGHSVVTTSSSRLDVPLLHVCQCPGGFSNGEVNMFRNFDLNNGPVLDDPGMETFTGSQHSKSGTSVPFLTPIAGLRMGSAEIGNVSSWFPPAAGPPRIFSSGGAAANFNGDVYRGPVLPSSPAMAFSPASAFSYGGFPFGASFPVTSNSFSGGSTTFVDSSIGPGSCFPTIRSQFVGTAAVGVSSHYPRPCVVSLPEGSTFAGSESNRKWGQQGFDLNSGPGSLDTEVKNDRLTSAPRQFPMSSSSQSFVEEQARMYQMVGGGVKRKEREGGPLDERFYKQPPWQ